MPARLNGVLTAGIFAVLSLALGGASCDKKSAANPTDPGPKVPFEAPPSAKPAAATVPEKPATAPTESKTPEPPATPDKAAKIAALEEKLPSPCGKAMSLKKTLESDPACKQGPFARRYVTRMVNMDVPDEELIKYYGGRYLEKDTHTFNLRDTPFIGSPNAPVVIVEFFDYACPHCREAMPVIEETVAAKKPGVALYYKHFPLHPSSMDTAKAAIAAYHQGKFEDMHHKLFANQGSQSREEILGYAKEIGCDMVKFAKELNDPATEARVKADKEEGQKTKLPGTPTIFINGKMFNDAVLADGLTDWIDEEMAVNR